MPTPLSHRRCADLRREQIALLRHEKRLIREARKAGQGLAINRPALLASAAAAIAAGTAAAAKLGAPALTAYAEAMQAATEKTGPALLVALAEIATAGHAAFETAANTAGFRLLADGGRPKPPPVEQVLSLLGIG